MKKITFFGCMLVVMLIVISALPLAISSETSNITIYVDDDAPPEWYDVTHVRTVQEGIDNASSGDTVFVYNGTYYENVVVNKTIDLIGEDKNTTIIDGGWSGNVVHVSADGVNISRFTIREGSMDGIVVCSNSNTITGNNIISNNDEGIRLRYFSNNTITGNIISNNNLGIKLSGSSSNTITGNNIISNKYYGISLSGSSSNTITGNIISNNLFGVGIYLQYSSSNTITGNIISNNGIGIWLRYSSTHNTITGNNIISNNYDSIYLQYSSSNTITGNIISNNDEGIYLYYSSSNAITGNNIISNNDEGIRLSYSSSNTITGNIISNNDEGIRLSDSSSNTIYLNNFIDNTCYVDSPWSHNIWNSTSLITYTYNGNTYTNYMGNHWDDYSGVDIYHGPNQDIPGSDVIGDTPYQISGGNNQDNYPLMQPYNQLPVADANGPYTIDEGDSLTLNASDSYDPDGSIIAYEWDLDNDGNYDDAYGMTPVITWNTLEILGLCDDGVYPIALNVTNDDGVTSTNITNLTIINTPPTVDAGSDANVPLGLSFMSSGLFTDPGCDIWTATVNYGDGSGDQPLTLMGWNFNLYHIYEETGDYMVTVTVTDDDLGVGSDTALATVYCAPEVWVDDDWHWQGDVDAFDPSLIWQHNAVNNIQDGIDRVCDCGTVHVLDGNYYEQILINKNVSLLGEPDATIKAPATLNTYTIESSSAGAPIIFAYGGTLTGSDVSGSGIISVMVDEFLINGLEKPGTVGILYHNVESGCVPCIISNNTIENVDIGIKIDGCTDDTTIIHNRITWPDHTTEKIAILITESDGNEPSGVEIHYNYWGIPCGVNIGVWNQVSDIVNATFNWWGAPDGPSSPPSGDNYDPDTGRLADGLGTRVIGLVHFDPWVGIDAFMTVSDTSVLVGTTIHFDASKSFAYYMDGATNTILEYLWCFGDGFFSMDELTVHTYDEPGIYNAYLRVMVIDLGLWSGFMYDWAYETIYVTAPGQPLGCNADGGGFGGYEGSIDEPIQFYGVGYGGTPPYSYEWDFGDSSAHSYLQNPTHVYDEKGTYTVTLTVTDQVGDIATDTAYVTVYEIDELVADAGGPYNGFTSEAVIFLGSATGGVGPYTYVWDFGDGSVPINGQTALHTYEEEGTYTATLTVTDSEGNTDEHTAIVTITENDYEEAEIKDIKGGLGVTATIIAGDMPVDWSISIDGRYVFLGGQASGNIAAHASETVRIPFSLGFGKVDITVTANLVVEERTGFMLGPLIFVP